MEARDKQPPSEHGIIIKILFAHFFVASLSHSLLCHRVSMVLCD